jgi:hypothetical protein
MKEAHGFLGSVLPPPPTGAMMSSTAEQVLSKFSDPSIQLCWGCESTDHMYYDRRKKKVICPHGDDPEVQARAEIVRKDFVARARKRRSDRRPTRESSNKKNQVSGLLSSASRADLLKIIQAFQTKTTPATQSQEHLVFIGGVQVLQANNLPQIPIAIHSALPHINLLIGQNTNSFQLALPVIVDTGSSICCGWTGYIMAIAKAYPELVKSITLAADRYSPIILSRVISNDAKTTRVVTHLPAIVEFHLPYKTTSGQPTSLQIAIGDDVSVNCLLGLSFMRTAHLVLDSHDNVVESCILDVEPFPIYYKNPQRCPPNLVSKTATSESKSLAIMAEIDQATEFIKNYVGQTDTAIDSAIEPQNPIGG